MKINVSYTTQPYDVEKPKPFRVSTMRDFKRWLDTLKDPVVVEPNEDGKSLDCEIYNSYRE